MISLIAVSKARPIEVSFDNIEAGGELDDLKKYLREISSA